MAAQNQDQKKFPIKVLLTGFISGGISRTVTNPFERLKMIQQVKVPEYANLNTLQSLAFMWRHEGFRGLLKGNGVNMLRIAPFSAFEMFFYDYYKQNLFGGDSASKLSKLTCAGMTGTTASLLTYPLDLLRTLMAINVADAQATQQPTIAGTAKEVYQNHGIRGFYRGLPVTLCGITPFVAFKMASFDIMSTYFDVKNSKNPGIYNFILGGAAGTFSVTITYPTDVVRRKMQVVGEAGQPVYSGFFDCCRKVIAVEGIQGIYAGLFACYLKVAPSMAILFWCNELLKKQFGA